MHFEKNLHLFVHLMRSTVFIWLRWLLEWFLEIDQLKATQLPRSSNHGDYYKRAQKISYEDSIHNPRLPRPISESRKIMPISKSFLDAASSLGLVNPYSLVIHTNVSNDSKRHFNQTHERLVIFIQCTLLKAKCTWPSKHFQTLHMPTNWCGDKTFGNFRWSLF